MTWNPVAIIQARLGSTRLPRKVMADICGKSMLERVMERAQEAITPHAVVVAIPDGPDDDELAEYVHGWPFWRGPELDVLARYVQAAADFGADPIIRVTADEPLLDPGIIDTCVRAYASVECDMVTNNLRRVVPLGLDVEVISREALERADRVAMPREREHVTDYIRRFGSVVQARMPDLPGWAAQSRWTVDTQEDLDFVRQVYAAISEPTTEKVLAWMVARCSSEWVRGLFSASRPDGHR